MKILIVDDDVVSRKKMAKIMEATGDCTEVESGKDALEAFINAWDMGLPFGVITLDIGLPDMSGVEVLKHIRDIESEKGITPKSRVKVIMVTSLSDQDVVVGSLEAGCDSYIVKPFDKDRVFEKLESLSIAEK